MVMAIGGPGHRFGSVQHRFNVCHFGARGDGVTRSARAIQAAIDAATDAAITRGPGAVSHVYVPPGAYRMERCLYLWGPYVHLIMDPGATLAAELAYPLISIGLPPEDGNPRGFLEWTDANYCGTGPSTRPDSFGLMDTSLAPSPGIHHGFRTNAFAPDEAVGVVFAGGACCDQSPDPAGWLCNQDAFTFELAFCGPGGTAFPDAGQIIGPGAARDIQNPQPWFFSTKPPASGGGIGQIRFVFRTNNYDSFNPSAAPIREIYWTKGTPIIGLAKFTLQVDFSKSTAAQAFTAWFEDGNTPRTKVTLNFTFLRPWSSGLRMYPGSFYSMMAAQVSGAGPRYQLDYEIHGFKYASKLLYDPSSPTLVRIDGGTVNDAFRFHGVGDDPAGARFHLACDEVGNTAIDHDRRWIQYCEGPGWSGHRGSALFGNRFSGPGGSASGTAPARYNRISGGRLHHPSPYGVGVTAGLYLFGVLDHLDFDPGMGFNFWKAPFGTNSYFTNMRWCKAGAKIAPLYLFAQGAFWLTDIDIRDPGRCPLLFRGASVTAQRIHIGHGQHAESLVRYYRGPQGGGSFYRDITTEPGQSWSTPPIQIEGEYSLGHKAEISNIRLGDASGNVVIALNDNGLIDSQNKTTDIRAYNIGVTNASAWVLTNGPRWHGQVVTPATTTVPFLKQHMSVWGPQSNVQIHRLAGNGLEDSSY